jgi:hypothetical protein
MTSPIDNDPEDDIGASLDLTDVDFDADDEDEEEDDETVCPDCGDPLDLVSGECVNPNCPSLKDEDDA